MFTQKGAVIVYVYVYGGGKQIAVYGVGGKQRAVNVNMFTVEVNKLP